MMKLFNEARNMSDIVEIRDYFRQVENLREVGFEIEFRVRTITDINRNIAELSSLQTKIKSGKITKYGFDEKLVTLLEEVIKVGREKWAPYILKSGGEYVEEGHFQHHCVGSYSSTINDCFIMSLKKCPLEKNGIIIKKEKKRPLKEERITVQINYKGEIYQARGSCNVDKIHSEPVGVLRERIYRVIKQFDGKFPIPRLRYENVVQLKEVVDEENELEDQERFEEEFE